MTGFFALLACFGDPSSDTVQETPVGLLPCEAPTPSTLSSGAPDGLVICADGSQNRFEAVTIPAWEPTSCLDVVEPGQPDVSFACTEDADCPAGAYCGHVYYEPFGEGCECAPFPCRSDSECGAGQACVRGGCVSAGCTSDVDCASGQCGRTPDQSA